MKNPTIWLWIALVLTAVLLPSAAQADLPCPLCPVLPVIGVQASEVVALVLSTLLLQGVAVLLVSSTALVSLPWLIAGVAAAAFYLPRRVRAWW